ncbi:MAG: pantoate--beta-alanine ligase [Planctomycetota bacterium]|nr:MAG: pantoate--beta-alanine ligase [Planctomycetota bacterium]
MASCSISSKPTVIRGVRDAREAINRARAAGRRIGFVPTMGALHAGHVSLIEASRKAGCYTVVSIYVNPTQFGPNEDFSAYPRTFEADLAACAAAGVELVFVPDNSEMYPPGDETRVQPGRLAETLCGPFRPGHFEGVCTVVAKLFNIVVPDLAFFGQKDAQQAAIIRRMVRDLCMPVTVEVCPLIRDADGLALSSRNVRLSPEQREKSLALYRALCAAQEMLRGGERSMGRIIAAMRAVIAAHAEIRVEYLSIVDPESLEDLSAPRDRMLVAGAIRVGDVRLIDNLLVELRGPMG